MWFSSFLLGAILGGGAGAIVGIVTAVFSGNFHHLWSYAMYGAIAGGLFLMSVYLLSRKQPVGRFDDTYSQFGSDASDTDRILHYHFAHKLLPSFVWEGDALFGILANPENQDYLPKVWKQLHQEARTAEGKPIPFIAPDGLGTQSYWLGGEHLVFLIRFPPAVKTAEADFAVITTSPTIHYYTLEKTLPADDGTEQTVVGEWTSDGTHCNYGESPKMTQNDFLHWVCRKLQMKECIEPPTQQQQEGLSLKGPVMNMYMPPWLKGELLEQVSAWEDQADKAMMEEQDFPKAERLARQILEVAMRELGPENTKATLCYQGLATALQLQERFAEEEQVCREWWAHCRRYRMLGHAETMLAVSSLAESIAAQKRVDEAIAMLRYRALLLGLSRGKMYLDAVHAREELVEIEKNFKAGSHP